LTKINIQMETTINSGDYNNVKLIYGIEEEPRADETVKAAWARVKGFIETELTTDAAQISEEWETLRKKRYGKRADGN
jgi:hypothetical protein